MRPDYDLTVLTTAFQELEQQFESVLNQYSKRVAANYIIEQARAVSRRNFSYIGNDQRWFHEGFALYLAYAVLSQLIGEEENELFWKKYFPSDGRLSLHEKTIFNWDDQTVSVRSLQAFSQGYFGKLHNEYGHEMVGNWFDALDQNQLEIKEGTKTVQSILEDLIGESMIDLWQSQDEPTSISQDALESCGTPVGESIKTHPGTGRSTWYRLEEL